jgi:menaquinone-dependent protoporphyrinogen IX oxidase
VNSRMQRVVLSCVVAGWAGWSAQSLWAQAEAQKPAEQKKARILIAAEKSEFKDAVLGRVAQTLEGRGAQVKRVDLSALAQEKVNDYDALVVANTIWAWHLRKDVRKFLAPLDDAQRGKVVLFSTAGDDGWKTKEKGVHAITSASKMAKADEVVSYIVGEVDAILKK